MAALLGVTPNQGPRIAVHFDAAEARAAAHLDSSSCVSTSVTRTHAQHRRVVSYPPRARRECMALAFQLPPLPDTYILNFNAY